MEEGGAHRDERAFPPAKFLWVLPRPHKLPRPVVPIRHKEINSVVCCEYKGMKERDGHITPVLAPVVAKTVGSTTRAMLYGKGFTPYGPTRTKVMPVRRQEACLPISALYPYAGISELKGEGERIGGKRGCHKTGGIQE